MRFDPLQIPDLLEAIRKERLIRDDGLLNTPEMVGCFELRKMTLEDYVILRIAQNPLLYGHSPTPAQLAQFLWFLSTDYSPKARLKRWFFLRQCRRYFMVGSCPFIQTSFAMHKWRLKAARATRRARHLVKACKDYVTDATQDRPPSSGGGYSPSYYSDALYWCALLGREYGYAKEDVMKMPLKALYGFIAEIRQERDPKAPKFNPSDKAVSRWLERQNTELAHDNN